MRPIVCAGYQVDYYANNNYSTVRVKLVPLLTSQLAINNIWLENMQDTNSWS